MSKEFEFFPKNQSEAIAMLYVEKAVENGCTPAEAEKVFWETLNAISKS